MLVVEKGDAQVTRWYRLRPEPFAPAEDAREAKSELLDAVRGARCKRHLISDVPVGLLLSGGIDSGLLLALMS